MKSLSSSTDSRTDGHIRATGTDTDVWPWSNKEPDSIACAPTAREFPKISVVTPSYNQAAFLEETIRSVVLQEYPNLEYIVLDGGSTDGSVAIIEKYSASIDHWESRPDRGQSDAINRGLRRASGEIQCWINSDDYFAPGALFRVAEVFTASPQAQWLVGSSTLIRQGDRRSLRTARQLTPAELVCWVGKHWFCQQSTFWRKSLIEQTGYLDESLHYLMDWDLWLRFYSTCKPTIVEDALAFYRFHDAAKCVSRQAELFQEEIRMLVRMWESRDGDSLMPYRTHAKSRLSEIVAPYVQSRSQERKRSITDYGSVELLAEVARRAGRRVSLGLSGRAPG